MKLSNKIVVVTGAASGLGRCLALQLGREGATIACVDYNEEGLHETIILLEAQGTACSPHRADVSSRADVERVVGEIDARHEGFDVLVNNAGIVQSFTTIANLEVEAIERITQVNYWGTVLFVKASLPILEARGESLIVNISSLSALLPFPGQTAYSASKAAVRILSEGLHLELKPKGVGVLLVMPGALRTEIVENSPFHSEEAKARFREMAADGGFGLTPERAAQKIIRAMTDRRYRLILGVEAFVLDKFYRIAPQTTCRLLAWAMQRSALTAAE